MAPRTRLALLGTLLASAGALGLCGCRGEDVPPEPEVSWPRVFDGLEETLAQATAHLEDAEAAAEDRDRALRSGADSAHLLQRVSRPLALLHSAPVYPQAFPMDRFVRLTESLDAAEQRHSALRSSLGVDWIHPGLGSIVGCLPGTCPPPPCDPVCITLCEWWDWLRCKLGGRCYLTPCKLFCCP